MSAQLSPTLLALIDALARDAARDYLTPKTAPDNGAVEVRSNPVQVAPIGKAA